MADAQDGGGAESPQALFESRLEQIESVISWISRRFCMRDDEAEEFRSQVHLKLIEGEYRVLRSFSGRSGLATYLTAVIQNVARDYRTSRWGRWRPSAAAERLGLAAVQLETLMERDGFTLDEASEMLRANHGVRLSRQELAELAGRLPQRLRPRLESDGEMEWAVSAARTDAGVEESENQRLLDRVRQVLASSLADLEVEDRLLLKMHYESGLTISAIAATLGLDQRRLYTRRDRCRRRLRRSLEAQGLDAATVLAALGWAAADFRVDYGVAGPELREAVPSNRSSVGDEGKR